MRGVAYDCYETPHVVNATWKLTHDGAVKFALVNKGLPLGVTDLEERDGYRVVRFNPFGVTVSREFGLQA
jgi:hypothetical protein